VPLSNAANRSIQVFTDVFGITPLLDSMSTSIAATLPLKSRGELAVGVDAIHGMPRLAAWPGMTWAGTILFERLAWVLVAFALVWLAALLFDRYSGSRIAHKQTLRMPIARIVPNIVGLRLVRAELTVLSGGVGLGWIVAALALGVAGAFAPTPALATVVLPLALLLPLSRYGSLQTFGRTGGVDALVQSAPHAVFRTIGARILAAGILGCVPIAGALFRLPALAVVPFAAAALALVIGRLSGSPRTFEALYIAVWYVGVVNHLGSIDFTFDALRYPIALALFGIATVGTAATVANVQLRAR